MTDEMERTDSETLRRRVLKIAQALKDVPYCKNLPCRVEDIDEGWVRLSFDVAPHLCNYRGIASGGVLAAFCDTIMGMASHTLGYDVTTLEINMNYIRPVHPGKPVIGVGQVVHHGGRTIVAECELMDENGKVVVKGRSSFYILKKYEV